MNRVRDNREMRPNPTLVKIALSILRNKKKSRVPDKPHGGIRTIHRREHCLKEKNRIKVQ